MMCVITPDRRHEDTWPGSIVVSNAIIIQQALPVSISWPDERRGNNGKSWTGELSTKLYSGIILRGKTCGLGNLKIIGTLSGLWDWDCSIGECMKSRNLSPNLERQIQKEDNE